jgi:hypothetical protein
MGEYENMKGIQNGPGRSEMGFLSIDMKSELELATLGAGHIGRRW